MKRLVFIAVMFISGVTYAQQQEHYSMYMMNKYMINPAEGGTEEFIDMKLGYRTQWVGLEGAPKTIFLSGHAPVGKITSRFEDVQQLPWHGVGGYVTSDEIGPYSIFNAKVSYSYLLPVTKELTISFGAFVGIKQYQLDESQIEFFSDFQQNSTQTDVVVQNTQSTLLPDASLGIWGYTKNYYFGLSTFQLFQNKVSVYDETGDAETGNLKMHHFITGGYRFELSPDLNLVPSFLIKAVSPAPVTFDINAKLNYKDLVWTGVSFRNQDAVVALVGFTYKKLIDIGYSFDFTTSDLSAYNNGTHEILLGLRLPNHEHEPPPAQFW